MVDRARRKVLLLSTELLQYRIALTSMLVSENCMPLSLRPLIAYSSVSKSAMVPFIHSKVTSFP